MEHYSVIVIGGGVVGASAAYHLARDGMRTLLVDRNDDGRATNAGAGILAPEMNKRDPDDWFNFAVQAVAYYPEMVEALRDAGGGDTSYARCGMLLVAATEDELEDFQQAGTYIFGRQRERGTPNKDALHTVTADEAKELFPALTDVLGAIYYRDAARVDGRHLAGSLHTAATNSGLTTKTGTVESLMVEADRVSGVIVDGDPIGADSVIIAGGAWSSAFGAQLDLTIPIQPQRGQIIHWDKSPSDTGRWPIVGAFHGHYIVCWPDGRVVTGATRETGSGFDVRTTAAGIREVIDEGLRVAPGLADASLLDIRIGLRPFPADGLPVLCQAPGATNVILATGHGPTGLQLGPFSGRIAADLATGAGNDVDIASFDVLRFQG